MRWLGRTAARSSSCPRDAMLILRQGAANRSRRARTWRWGMKSTAATVLCAFAGLRCSDEEISVPLSPRPATGSIVVAAHVHGEGADADGFRISVDAASERVVMPDSAVVFPAAEARTHIVRLDGIAENCALLEPNSQTVSVYPDQVTPIVFNVTCVSEFRSGIQVRAARPAVASFAAALDGMPMVRPEYGSVLLSDLVPGNHVLALKLDAGPCTLDGPNPRHVDATAGTIARSEFTMTCPPGSLVVSVVTTGTRRAGRYSVRVVRDSDPYCYDENCQFLGLDAAGHGVLTGLAADKYFVQIGSVPANCTVTPGYAVAVAVAEHGWTDAAFAIRCR